MLVCCISFLFWFVGNLINLFSEIFWIGKFKEAEGLIRKSTEDEIVLDTIAYNTFIKAKLDAGIWVV
jgi:hypothetical protein